MPCVLIVISNTWFPIPYYYSGCHPQWLFHEIYGFIPVVIVQALKSCPTLCDPVDGSPQASLSMGFLRQEYWSGLPFPSPGNRPNPEIEPRSPASPALAGWSLTTELPINVYGKPIYINISTYGSYLQVVWTEQAMSCKDFMYFSVGGRAVSTAALQRSSIFSVVLHRFQKWSDSVNGLELPRCSL